jgi:predicted ATPase with chaperone activity
MEKLMELLVEDHLKFRDQHRQLLTAQVGLTDLVDKLTARVDKVAVSVADLMETQKHTDERLNALWEHTDERLSALIDVVDDLIRKRPPQAS